MQIVISSAYVDFKVSRSKYLKLKTDCGRSNLIYRTLDSHYSKLVGTKVKSHTIRDVHTTSNEFWGSTPLLELEDGRNVRGLHLNHEPDYLIFRLAHCTVISVVDTGATADHFIELLDDNISVVTSTYRVI